MTGRALVVSPHCDDAVFGCAGLIAEHRGAVVVTVFAGRPGATANALTRWDADCGFQAGDDVMAVRRTEDAAALARLGAAPCWLEFLDAQYGPSPSAESVAAALEALVAEVAPAIVAVPLGLFHSDHRLVHDAGLIVMRRCPAPAWLAYEDAMYRRVPGLRDERLDTLRAAGLTPEPYERVSPVAAAVKRDAVGCYASQLRGLDRPGMPGVADALAPERYWRFPGRREAVA